ncbi:MAG TPA: hypothetical protein ENK57_07365 [Polyangiaceae bacterium]|nr:hypothetical protein [Polyangiaceae bacterium]
MSIRTAPLALFLILAACQATPEAQTSDDASAPLGGAKTAVVIGEGTSVCVDGTLGQRYLVEEALEDAGLVPVDSCMAADVVVEEQGEPGGFLLRYQHVGDAEWATCESEGDDHVAFLQSCASEMVGASPLASVE